MTFLLLLIALIVERFFAPIAVIRRWGWLSVCYSRVERMTSHQLSRQVYRYFLLLLAVLLLLFVTHHLFFQSGLANIIFCFVILLLCLGPKSQYGAQNSVKQIDTAETENTAAEAVQKNNLPVLSDDLHHKTMQALRRIFAPFLWFALLGVLGVVVYRITERLPRNRLHQQILQYFDWLPLRLLTLAFALVSYFIYVFPLWLKTLTQLPAANEAVVRQLLDSSLAQDANELHLAALLDRALIVWLVIVALIVLL